MFVVSPHFDDAVLSCGALLAQHPGSQVLTVCAGLPEEDAVAPEWDQRCGFSYARQAMLARREENRQALHKVDAIDLHLNILDSQYGGHAQCMEQGLLQSIRQWHPDTVLFPLGLFHEDHLRVNEAVLRVRAKYERTSQWIAYEDVPYRRIPGLVQQRLAWLAQQRIWATPWLTVQANTQQKRLAVAAYTSQLGPMGLTAGQGDDALPEQYWKLGDQRGDHA